MILEILYGIICIITKFGVNVMNNYIGIFSQIRGAERYILQDGKGDGMHFIFIRNGLGLEAWISVDRCGDISRLCIDGKNLGYFSPCGYVSPQYYDREGLGFLKSFTAGFITTCGLTAVGSPCVDDGEELGLHGTIANTPAVVYCMEEEEQGITIKLKVSEQVIFGKKVELDRVYHFSYTENIFEMQDTVTNCGNTEMPYMILYHCNMGYPLLSENSIVKIPNNSMVARNVHAQENIDKALQMEKPQADYEECCYYYDVAEKNGFATVGIYNPDIEKGVIMSYDKKALPKFTEWKMMGERDYALGLEPGNCTADGRDAVRKSGELKFLSPCEKATTTLKFEFVRTKENFESKV